MTPSQICSTARVGIGRAGTVAVCSINKHAHVFACWFSAAVTKHAPSRSDGAPDCRPPPSATDNQRYDPCVVWALWDGSLPRRPRFSLRCAQVETACRSFCGIRSRRCCPQEAEGAAASASFMCSSTSRLPTASQQ